MSIEDLKSILGKYILLDTNVLIDSAKFPEDFSIFYNFLQENNIISILDPTIRLEFIRGAQTRKDKELFEVFLNETVGSDRIELKPSEKIFGIAENIALITAQVNNAKMDLGDCLIAAQMASIKTDLLIATQNHQDFPAALFDRLHVEIIPVSETGKIKTVGIYKMNKGNYEILSRKILNDNDPYKLK